ncbi:response regulator [Aliikangiella maris]|uniref:Response regulator n=2 Tax=Aliikangiella maris TaxID=3162458 RepID=A0ABV3MSL4_9GAMM
MTSEFKKQLSQLTADFKQEIPLRLSAIKQEYQLINPKKWHAGAEKKLYALLHKLAGTAGTLGWHALSEASSELLKQLSQISAQATPDLSMWEKIGLTIFDLEQIAEIQVIKQPDELEMEFPSTVGQLIFIVDDDNTLTELLANTLHNKGYITEQFNSPDDFAQTCRNGHYPDLVLMDMDFPDGAFAGGEVIAQLRHELDIHLPSIFISKHDSMESRLTAFRAGASRYLLKPVNLEQLCRLTDELCTPCGEDPYRVMVVDDDNYTLHAFVIALEAAGMVVEGVNNPLEVLDRVRLFMPDVLLLDVYMPEATGPEIAAVLREEEQLSWLPILFLSVETDPSKHALALAHGGDDFLMKPIQPNYLQEAVKARAWRARRNRQLMRAALATL